MNNGNYINMELEKNQSQHEKISKKIQLNIANIFRNAKYFLSGIYKRYGDLEGGQIVIVCTKSSFKSYEKKRRRLRF